VVRLSAGSIELAGAAGSVDRSAGPRSAAAIRHRAHRSRGAEGSRANADPVAAAADGPPGAPTRRPARRAVAAPRARAARGPVALEGALRVVFVKFDHTPSASRASHQAHTPVDAAEGDLGERLLENLDDLGRVGRSRAPGSRLVVEPGMDLRKRYAPRRLKLS